MADRPIRYCAVLATLLPLALVGPASAGAGYPSARFTTSLKGTFTSTGHQTDTCRRYAGPDDLEGTQFMQETTVEDRVVFKSTRAGVAQVDAIARDPIGAGMLKNMRGSAVWTRTRTKTPAGPCQQGEDADICGERKHSYPMGIFGRADRDALRYDLRTRYGPLFPDDPYERCALVTEQISWGKIQPVGAKVSRAKLFNRHVKRIVVKGHDQAVEPPPKGDPGGARSSRDLRYTITLVRRH